MRLNILTDNPVTEDFYTCKRQPRFHPDLCDLRIKFQTERSSVLVTLYLLILCPHLSWWLSLPAAKYHEVGTWTGNKQLTSHNRGRGTTKCCNNPHSAAAWKSIVISPEGKLWTVTLVVTALQNRQITRRNGNIHSNTHSVPGSSLHMLFYGRHRWLGHLTYWFNFEWRHCWEK